MPCRRPSPFASTPSPLCRRLAPQSRCPGSRLRLRLCRSYKHDHEVDIETHSVAQMLGNTLYGRRFFPYYAFNVLSGLDAEGKGAVYTYDAVGSFERVPYACQGAGQRLIIPYLDNVVGFKCRSDKPEGDLTPEEAVNVAKDAFITAAERQIRVGDSIRIFTIARGVAMKETRFEIRKD